MDETQLETASIHNMDLLSNSDPMVQSLSVQNFLAPL
jgi:hypothetical protein